MSNWTLRRQHEFAFLTFGLALLFSSLVWAQGPGGGPGGPGAGGGAQFDNLSMSFDTATSRLTVSYDGAGSEPSPSPWAEMHQGNWGGGSSFDGLDFERTYTDANGLPIRVGAGSHTFEFQIPTFPGTYTLLILKEWIIPGGITPAGDPVFYVVTFSIDAQGAVTQSVIPAELIGYTSVVAVQTSRPCDGGSDPTCARFPGSCQAEGCDIEQHQDQLRLLYPGALNDRFGVNRILAGGCNSCGSGGGELGSASADFSPGSASCSGGSVPPGAPNKNCGVSSQDAAGHVDIGLQFREEMTVFPSSFGLGGFMGAYDGFIQRFDIPNGETKLRIFDPAYRQVYTGEYDAVNDKFDEMGGRIRKMEYVNGKPRAIYHDGAWCEYSFYDTSDNDGVIDDDGFVTKISDAAGREVNIVRDSNGKIITISDQFGTVASVAYGTTLQGGRPAVEAITVTSDGASPRVFSFTYTDARLSEVKLGSEKLWSSTTTVNASAQTAEKEVYNAFVGKRYFNFTQDYITLNGMLVAQPTNLIRNIEDSNGVSLVAIFVNPNDADDKYEMIGTSILKHYKVSTGPTQATASVGYATNWSVGDITQGWSALTVNAEEPQSSQRLCIYPPSAVGIGVGTASQMQGEDGIVVGAEYDADGFLTKKIYGGPTDYEQYTLNVNKKITQYRRRDGVTFDYTYLNDALVTSVARDGVTQTLTYYSTNDARNLLVHEVRDALYAGGSPTMHCVTYEYTTDRGTLSKVWGPAASNGSTRAQTQFVHNGKRQKTMSTVKRAVGNDYVEEFVYDGIGRLTQINYLSDGTNRQISYIDSPANPWTNNAAYGLNDCAKNVAVLVKDRNNIVERTLYADFKLYQTIKFFAKDSDLFTSGWTITGAGPEYNREYRFYNAGTNLLNSVRPEGDSVYYYYDYRGRQNRVRRYKYQSQYQDSLTTYGPDSQVLHTTDPYGRRTWYGRSYATGQVLRTIQEFVPGNSALNLSDNASVLAANRGLNDNASFAITDRNYDVVGRQLESIDPMGIVTKMEYNNRDQTIKQTAAFGTSVATLTETDYDLTGKVTQVRHPRYFDSTDTNGHQKDKTTYAYDGAGRNVSVTRAPGTPLAATTQTVYHWDDRIDKTIDALGNATTRKYEGCCDQSTAVKNALGHGSISNADPEGRTYHTAIVGNVDTHSNYFDPTNANTYRESTTLYDGLGRAKRTTQWNAAQGQIDHDAVPTAGFGSVAGTAGITSQTIYDTNMGDTIGLSNTSGLAVTTALTGATFNVSLRPALTILSGTTANGGAGITFNTSTGSGSAAVQVNHDASQVTFQINDSLGRTVMSGQLKGPSATNPSEVLNWTCISHDNMVSINGYGSVQEIRTIDMDGNITRNRVDAGGRTLESEDMLGNIAKSVYKADGRLVKSIDAMTKETTYAYDALGRQISMTNAITVTTSQSYNKASMVVSQTDGKQNTSTLEYDVLGRLISETDRTNATTTKAYNLNGQLTLITDAQSKATAYTYNVLGQRTGMTYSDGGGQSVIYHPSGYAQEITKPSGIKQLVSVNTFTGTLSSMQLKNAVGTVTGTSSFTYDDLRRKKTSTGMYAASRAGLMTITDVCNPNPRPTVGRLTV